MSFGWNETNGRTSLTTQTFSAVSGEDRFKGHTLAWGQRAKGQRPRSSKCQFLCCPSVGFLMKLGELTGRLLGGMYC